MAAGDRNKNGRPKDFVRHYGNKKNPTGNYLLAICGNKAAGYVTDDMSDVTCLKCLKKINIKQPTMKTEAQPTAKHGQDKPQKKDFCYPSIVGENFVKVDYKGYVKALEEYISKNEKCVNMHDELVKMLRYSVTLLNGDDGDKDMQNKMLELLTLASQK